MPSRISIPESVDMALVNPEYNVSLFFTDDEVEFYEDGMSKNLFKKFELHTPPQSPPHNPFPPDQTVDSVDTCLKLTSKALESGFESLAVLDDLSITSKMIQGQDCMWSGPCLQAAGLISPPQKKSPSLCSDSKVPSSPGASLSDSRMSQTMDINSEECVSPAAVFPYPENVLVRQKGIETTSFNLGSCIETPSPSESEDEEEIDVVTVVAEKMARKRQCPNSNSSSIMSAAVTSFKSHVASIHNYSNTSPPPASFSAPQSPLSSIGNREVLSHSHKRCRPMSMPASPQPAKKSRSLLNSTTDLKRLKCVAQKLTLNQQNSASTVHLCTSTSNSSRNSSDSEEGDTTKRAQHNVLERKRRNDLKYSFLKLRDHVPELARQERSPKVTILKLSADYIRSIAKKNKALESELERTKSRYEQVKSKLMALRRECL